MSSLELKGLKGLRSLDKLISESQVPQPTLAQLETLPIEAIISGQFQPRKHINENVLIELANSIKAQGIIQPLIVRKTNQNNYEIIAGERRWRAAKIAGLAHVPAIVRAVENSVALAFAVIENIQRENLNPVEEAQAFVRFKDEFFMTHEDIAQMVGRSRTSITNTIRLLALCEPVLKLLEEGKLDMGHARALLTLDPQQQIEVAAMIVAKQQSVREAEKLANLVKNSQLKNKKNSIIKSEKYEYWSQELSSKFSTKVAVKLNAKGSGKIIIHVDSSDKIEWIIDHIELT